MDSNARLPGSAVADAESLLATWVAGPGPAQAPLAVRSVARTCIADGLGVMLAGTRNATFAQCASLSRAAGDCTVADGSANADAAGAAFLNAVACHVLDFDDTSYAGIVHGTAVVLPAVLAVAEAVNASGEEMLAAFIAGVEAEYALGLAVTDSLYERGFWATATLGVFGAAAGAARLLGLDAVATAHALRLAANTPVGLRATHGSSGKPYLCGMAARLGVEAACAARAGISGMPGTLEGTHGFAQACNAGLLRREAVLALGHRWALLEPGIAFKLRPLCSATQAAVEATIALRTEHRLQASDVRSVLCQGTPLVASCLPYAEPQRPSEAQFSMQFAIACTLLHGDVRLDHLDAGLLASDTLHALMNTISLRADPTLVAAAQAPTWPEAARVEITLHDGRRLEHAVMAATGMPTQPATAAQLQAKFMDCAMRALGAMEAGELWNRAARIEQVPRMRQLFQGLLGHGANHGHRPEGGT